MSLNFDVIYCYRMHTLYTKKFYFRGLRIASVYAV